MGHVLSGCVLVVSTVYAGDCDAAFDCRDEDSHAWETLLCTGAALLIGGSLFLVMVRYARAVSRRIQTARLRLEQSSIKVSLQLEQTKQQLKSQDLLRSSRWNSQVEALTSEVKKKDDEAQALLATQQSLTERVLVCEAVIADLRKETTRLSCIESNLDEKILLQEIELKEAQMNLDARDQMITELSSRFQSDSEAFRSEIKNKDTRIEALIAAEKDLKEQNLASEAAVLDLGKQLEEQTNQFLSQQSSLETQLKSSQKEIQRLTRVQKELIEQNQGFETQCRDSGAQISELEISLERVSEDRSELEKQNQSLKAETQRLITIERDLTERTTCYETRCIAADARISELGVALKKLRKERSKLEIQLKSCQDENQRLLGVEKDLEEKSTTLQSRSNTAEARVAELEVESSRNLQERSELRQQLNSAISELEAVRGAASAFEDWKRETEKEIQSLKVNLETCKEDKSRLHVLAEQSQAQASWYQQNCEALHREKTGLCEAANTEIARLSLQQEHLSFAAGKEIETLVNMFRNGQASWNFLVTQFNALQSQLQRAREEKADLLQSLGQTQSGTRVESVVQSSLASLEAEKVKLTQELSRINGAQTENLAQISSLQSALTESENQRSLLFRDLEKTKEENTRMRNYLGEIQNRSSGDQVPALQESLEALRREKTQLVQELSSLQSESQRQCSALQESLEAFQREKSQFLQEQTSSQSHILNLINEKAAVERDLARSQEQFSSVQSHVQSLESEKQDLLSQNSRMSEQISQLESRDYSRSPEAEEENARLLQEVRALKDELEELRREVSLSALSGGLGSSSSVPSGPYVPYVPTLAAPASGSARATPAASEDDSGMSDLLEMFGQVDVQNPSQLLIQNFAVLSDQIVGLWNAFSEIRRPSVQLNDFFIELVGNVRSLLTLNQIDPSAMASDHVRKEKFQAFMTSLLREFRLDAGSLSGDLLNALEYLFNCGYYMHLANASVERSQWFVFETPSDPRCILCGLKRGGQMLIAPRFS